MQLEGYRETKRNKLNKSNQQNQISENNNVNNNSNNSNSSLEELASLHNNQQQPQQQVKPNTSGISAVGKHPLSSEEKNHLDDIMSDLNRTSSENSKWIKFDDGASKVLQIMPELTALTKEPFASDPNKPVARCKFMVYELVSDTIGGQLRKSSDEPKEWNCSITLAKEVIKWNQRGYTVLRISREGTGLKTKWLTEPVVE